MSRAKRLRKSAFIGGKEYITSSFQESAALEQLSSTADAALAAASVPPPPSDKITLEVWPVGFVTAGNVVAFDPTTANGSYFNGYPLVDTIEDYHFIDHGTCLFGVAEDGLEQGQPGTITIQGPAIVRTAGNSTPYGGITAGTSLYPYFETFPYIVDGWDQGLRPIGIALEDYGETGVGTNKIRMYVNPPQGALTWPDGIFLDNSQRIRTAANGGMAPGTLVVTDSSVTSDEWTVRQYDPTAGDVFSDVLGITPYTISNNGIFALVMNGEVGKIAVAAGSVGATVYTDTTNPHLLTTVNTSGNVVGYITRDNGDNTYTVLFQPRR